MFSFTIHNRFPYRIPREKFSALDLNTGEVEELDEADRLTEFIDSWKEVIAERVIATLNPIYDFDYQRMDDRVEKVLRQPQPLPAPPRKGQKHVTVAIWKRLLESDYTICVGEMGVGKTTIAVSVAALLGDEGYPALVTMSIPSVSGMPLGSWELIVASASIKVG